MPRIKTPRGIKHIVRKSKTKTKPRKLFRKTKKA